MPQSYVLIFFLQIPLTRQKRQRVVESISVENDTILFRPKITYYFREDMSEGRLESDVITLIDIPYVVNYYRFTNLCMIM